MGCPGAPGPASAWPMPSLGQQQRQQPIWPPADFGDSPPTPVKSEAMGGGGGMGPAHAGLGLASPSAGSKAGAGGEGPPLGWRPPANPWARLQEHDILCRENLLLMGIPPGGGLRPVHNEPRFASPAALVDGASTPRGNYAANLLSTPNEPPRSPSSWCFEHAPNGEIRGCNGSFASRGPVNRGLHSSDAMVASNMHGEFGVDMVLSDMGVALKDAWHMVQDAMDSLSTAWCSHRDWPSPRNGEVEYALEPWLIRSAPSLSAQAQEGGAPAALAARRGAPVDADAYGMGCAGQEQPVSDAEMAQLLSRSRLSMYSVKGNKASAPNQDRASCAVLAGGFAQMFSVFDGHGVCGHLVADAVADQLPKLLARCVGLPSWSTHAPQAEMCARLWSEGASKAFEDMHAILEALTFRALGDMAPEAPSSGGGKGSGATDLRDDGVIDARASGTTATVCLLLPEQLLLVAHVGDSRAVFASRQLNGGAWRVTALTRDHKPDLPGERQRIESTGGQVLIVGNGQHQTSRVVTPQQSWPSINMSRSLGDLHAHSQGLSAVAEVYVGPRAWNPREEQAVLIIGSDGLWDVITPDEAVDIAAAHRQQSGVALSREAYRRWGLRGLQGNYSDDITVVVKFL
eukprot:TRINITY_DN2734_c0_g1_i3.p1 TRINITY_DN2734_c0_g1~~TRINITY_DN2734_c0_g1_i3.p1  ORF type:complete len:649 (-),score=118.28 TRINITY_DN2734_c0_g1_i3:113-1999(-)